VRTELYADSRDEWKWSVALRHAPGAGQSIYWAAMLRPAINQHGNDRAAVPNALPEVTSFLLRERDHLAQGQPRSLGRITRLCDLMGPELFANFEPYPTTFNERGRYIGSIVRSLLARGADLRHLVLLDPDNGIGESRTNGKQVHVAHVQQIWKALQSGDTLALVQFQHFIPDWVETLKRRLADVLAVAPAQVRAFHCGTFASTWPIGRAVVRRDGGGAICGALPT
jgi:hypothetical protein